MSKLLIPIILGTEREGRQSEKVANYMSEYVEGLSEVDTELLDVRDMDLNFEAGGESLRDKNPKYVEVSQRADAFIFVLPEYNHSFPGGFKTAVDFVFTDMNHKAAGIVGVSSGPFGGSRMIEHTLPVMRELGLVQISYDLYFTKVGEAFDEQGKLKEVSYNERTDKFLSELLWMTIALKSARENIIYD